MNIEKRRVGLVLGGDSLSMSYRSGPGQMVQTEIVACDTGLRTGALGDIRPALDDLAGRFPGALKRADVTLNVALPDPLFQSAELDFDVFPKKKKAAGELVAWQYGVALDLDPATRAIGYIAQQTEQGAHVLAHSVPKDLVTKLKSQLWEHSMIPSRIDALGSYLFAPPPKSPRDEGIELYLGAEWWRFQLRGGGLSSLYFSVWSMKDASLAPMWSRLKRMVMSQGTNWGNDGMLRLMHDPDRDLSGIAENVRELGLEVKLIPCVEGHSPSRLVAEGAY